MSVFRETLKRAGLTYLDMSTSRVGRTQRGILELLTNAVEDGLSISHLASSLGITERAVEAAVERLETRGLAVFTKYTSIAWLPDRRLAWLRSRAAPTEATAQEIENLAFRTGLNAPDDKVSKIAEVSIGSHFND